MAYEYMKERASLFTETGVARLLEIRDQVGKLLAASGAFRETHIRSSGDSFFTLAALDYLVELGEIERLPRDCWRQYAVYAEPKVHNL